MATFAEQLKEQLGAFIPEDKRAEFESSSGQLFEALNKTIEGQTKDLKTYKQKLAELEKAAGGAPTGVDAREYEELKRKLEERESAYEELNSKHSDITRKYSMTEKQAKEYSEKLAREASEYSELVKQSELRKAMGVLSLTEGTSDEVYNMLAQSVKVSVNDKGVRKVSAIVPDAEGKPVEKPLADYVKDWAATSAVAKRILAAPRTSGGGATGAQGSVGGPATLEQKYHEAFKAGNVALALMYKERMTRGEE